MTTYRILLVITAVCSALITAVFINPVNSSGSRQPLQFEIPHIPYTLDNERNLTADPLTLALRMCTADGCEYIALSTDDSQHFLSTENEAETQNSDFQRTVPLHLPQRGVPIIEM